MKWLKSIEHKAGAFVIILLIYLADVSQAKAQCVTLSWDASSGPGVAGYDIYYGTSSQSLSLEISVGDVTAATICGLTAGATYYFAATARNSSGMQSQFSNITSCWVPTNQLPSITQITNQSIAIGQSLRITNQVLAATPPVTFSLDSSAPAGATISTNGLFRWTPTCEQGSSNYSIIVWATDSSFPPLSNFMTFSVAVGACVQVTLGSTAVQIGQTGALAVSLLSTVGLTNLNFAVFNPSCRLTNWTFATSNSSVETANLQVQDSSNVLISLDTFTGQTLQGQSLLGTVSVTPLAGPSTFVPLIPADITGTQSNGASVAGNIQSLAGRVAVIGLQPLIEAGLGSNSTRILTLYGNLGTNYEVLFSTNLLRPNWEIWSGYQMTNLIQAVAPDQIAPQIFYRVVGLP